MKYDLIIPDRVNKKLDKLGVAVKSRIISCLILLKQNPRRHAEKLFGTEFWKTRIGKYRVIYSIEDDKLVILIVDVGHRKKIYKKFCRSVMP
jgi:mRNA interferase RelE/StbE